MQRLLAINVSKALHRIVFHITTKKSLSVIAAITASLFIAWASYYMGAYKVMYTITWDVAGYYMYLPSVFYDWFTNPQNVGYIMENYRPMPEWYGTIKLGNGNQVMRYTGGQAIMYTPAFFIAHIWAKISGYPVDGFSYPYQFCLNWWSTLVAIAGIWIMRLNLLKHYGEVAVGITLLIIPFATNFISYATWSSPMTHCYLFTLYSLLIFFNQKFYQSQTIKWSVLIGLICGLITLTRFTDGICLLIPFLWGLHINKNVLNSVLNRVNNKHYYIMLLLFVAIVSIQLLYWKKVTGEWYFHVYWGEYLDFTNIYFFKGLFSYERGWLTYSPIMWLAILGVIYLWIKQSEFALSVTLFVAINISIVLSWNNWNYGGGYGHRAMIQSYAILCFPLAAMIQLLLKKFPTRYFLIVSVAILSWVNCGMALGKYLPASGITKQYFWHVWGKWKIEPGAEKLLNKESE